MDIAKAKMLLDLKADFSISDVQEIFKRKVKNLNNNDENYDNILRKLIEARDTLLEHLKNGEILYPIAQKSLNELVASNALLRKEISISHKEMRNVHMADNLERHIINIGVLKRNRISRMRDQAFLFAAIGLFLTVFKDNITPIIAEEFVFLFQLNLIATIALCSFFGLLYTHKAREHEEYTSKIAGKLKSKIISQRVLNSLFRDDDTELWIDSAKSEMEFLLREYFDAPEMSPKWGIFRTLRFEGLSNTEIEQITEEYLSFLLETDEITILEKDSLQYIKRSE